MATVDVEQNNNRSLSDQIADILSNLIAHGELRPGERIVESRVARQLGVSQGSVREALQRLEHQGLITRELNRGATVTQLKEEDVAQIYRTRELLEGLAMELAVARFNKSDEAALSGLIQTMEKAARKGDLAAFVKADFAFHDYIWKLAGDPHLERALLSVACAHFGYSTIQHLFSSTEEMQDLADSHRSIVEVLKRKDGKTANRFMRQSMRTSCQLVLKKMKEAPRATLGPHLLGTAKRSEGAPT